MKLDLLPLGQYCENSAKYWASVDLSKICIDNLSQLVVGNSGTGKSVCLQNTLIGLASRDFPVLAISVHNTMTPDQIYPPISSQFEALANRLDGYRDPIRCQLLTPATFPDGQQESACDVANAIAEIIGNVFRFGIAQFSELSAAAETVMKSGAYSGSGFCAIEHALHDAGSKSAASVAQRLHPLFRHNVFQDGKPFFQNGKINILDLSKYDSRTQRIIAELVLYDIWHRVSTSGKQMPLFICIDEFQNLGLSKEGILGKFLAEGRKYGLNLILVTQSLGIHFNTAQEKLLCQARFKLFFRPSEADARHVASLISEGNMSSVISTLKRLKTGECLLSGPAIIGDSTQPITEPILISTKLRPVSKIVSDDPKVPEQPANPGKAIRINASMGASTK